MDGFSMFLRAKSLEIWWPFPGLLGETQEVLRRDSKKVSIYVYIYIYTCIRIRICICMYIECSEYKSY